jgi:hypothetical protein
VRAAILQFFLLILLLLPFVTRGDVLTRVSFVLFDVLAHFEGEGATFTGVGCGSACGRREDLYVLLGELEILIALTLLLGMLNCLLFWSGELRWRRNGL